MAATPRSQQQRSIAERAKAGWETLQSTLQQSVETVTRTARVEVSSSGVDEIDPPKDLDEYWDQYKNTAIVRANIDQFVSDVVKPGVRVEADSNATVDYFMGGDRAPSDTPEGGFLDNSFVFAGEKHQPFLPGLKTTITNRWVRGTALIELLKADKTDADSQIAGFYHIRPETVHPQVYAQKNILLDPDPNAPENENIEVELTERDEVAAYLQFSDESILGRRLGRMEQETIPLSQNDVMKQVLDPDIGGDDAAETGIFGEPIGAAINEDVTEYNSIKRDRHTAIQTKAYGIWLANFSEEVLENPDGPNEINSWNDGSQDDFMETLGDLSPGDVMGADGPIDLEKFDSDVPDLNPTLSHYVDDITAALPAPKFAIGFEENINQFVTEQQETRYQDIINEERRYQERKWTDVLRTIAERHPMLDPSGLRLVIEPEQEESPVQSLSDEEIDKLRVYTQAIKDLYGSGSAASFVDDDMLRELVLQLPEDSDPPEPNPTPGPEQTGEQPPDDEPSPSDEELEQIDAQFAQMMLGND